MHFLLDHKSYIEILVIFAQLLIFPITEFGVYVARWAIKSQREINATQAHLAYVRLAYEHPDFALPRLIKNIDYDKQTIRGKRLKFEEYEWFVAHMLGAMRLVIALAPNDSAWRKVASLQ